MKWPRKRRAPELAELEQRATEAEKFVEKAEAINETRREEVDETATWFRERKDRNHLSDLFYAGLRHGGNL